MVVSSSDFDFNSSRSSQYLSAPSSPKPFNDYFLSAPASPSGLSEFYVEFENFCAYDASPFPLDWEDRPGRPRSSRANASNHDDNDDDDFAFAVASSAEPKKSYRSAEELFDGGKIKPLKPQPRFQLDELGSALLSPRIPSAQGRKKVPTAFSARKKREAEPFAIAADNNRKKAEHPRGRDRTPAATSSFGSGRRATRSHSPYRVPEYPWEEGNANTRQQQNTTNPKSTHSASKSSRKWRLRDLLLFRSASEGRPVDKDPFRKYSVLDKKAEDAKNSNPRRKAPFSAHELHYATKKAASEDLKKQTFLPYKQGILGRFAFNPKLPFMK